MDIFLKVLGVLAFVVILLLAGLASFLWWKFRSHLKSAANSFPTPATIDLVLDADPDWVKNDEVEQALRGLGSCGYTRGPAYTVEGMPGVGLIAFTHQAGVVACYYNHESIGNWTDLIANFTDGLELTICNAPEGHQLDTRPDTEKVFLPEKTGPELHAILLERIEGRNVKPIALAEFKHEFLEAYRKDMAWRNGRNGTSEAEFLRIAVQQDPSLTDEELKAAFQETKLEELRLWSAELIEAFESSTDLPVSDWKRYQNNFIIFRESFHPGAYLDYLAETVCLEDDALAKYRLALDGGISLSGLLTRIANDTGCQFTRLGEVEEPTKTEIYGVTLPAEVTSEAATSS